MIKAGETWSELDQQGKKVVSQRLDFDSIPEQIAFLRTMINVYRGTTWAKELALQLVRDCEHRNKACYAMAIAEAVQGRVKYINELPETFQTPVRTWNLRAGDCDDFTTLIGTLIETLGITVEVVGMKINGKWRHVFPRALVPGRDGKLRRMVLDATIKGTPVRQMVNPITRSLARGYTVDTFTLSQ